jgi:hypothetical protein
MKPLLQALLIADHVYEDKVTGKKIVAGIFHRLAITQKPAPSGPPGDASYPVPENCASVGTAVPGEPAAHDGGPAEGPTIDPTERPNQPTATPIDIRHLQRAGSPYAYISVTELNGPATFRLQCVDLLDNQVLFSTELSAKAASPLDTVEMIAPLPPLPEVRGSHLGIELLWEGELLGVVRIAIDRRVLP